MDVCVVFYVTKKQAGTIRTEGPRKESKIEEPQRRKWKKSTLMHVKKGG
jgi:hypothetical protein